MAKAHHYSKKRQGEVWRKQHPEGRKAYARSRRKRRVVRKYGF